MGVDEGIRIQGHDVEHAIMCVVARVRWRRMMICSVQVLKHIRNQCNPAVGDFLL